MSFPWVMILVCAAQVQVAAIHSVLEATAPKTGPSSAASPSAHHARAEAPESTKSEMNALVKKVIVRGFHNPFTGVRAWDQRSNFWGPLKPRSALDAAKDPRLGGNRELVDRVTGQYPPWTDDKNVSSFRCTGK